MKFNLAGFEFFGRGRSDRFGVELERLDLRAQARPGGSEVVALLGEIGDDQFAFVLRE
jgi:hypothetical protein